MRISWFTSSHAFECFFNADITANNIQVVIPSKIDYIKSFISDQLILSPDIGGLRVYTGVLTDSWGQLDGRFHGREQAL